MRYTHVPSLLGKILVAGDDAGLRVISFQEGTGAQAPAADWKQDATALRAAVDQLEAYFAGELKSFDLPLAPAGTDFQQAVWDELLSIPYGATSTYGELARAIGRPQASRAVGAANGSNPLPIVIPCHRVIGSTGKLTGYGGGLHIKKALLALERGETQLL